MQKNYGQNDEEIARYVADLYPESDEMKSIRVRSLKAGLPPIHVGPMDGVHLGILTRAIGARRAVEIGTLAGYSGVIIARALAPGGSLDTFEFDSRHAEIASATFREFGCEKQVKIWVGAALDNLPQLKGEFDLVFLDADKTSYPAYLDWAAENLRVGGLLVADNTVAWGFIATKSALPEMHKADILALREFNKRLAAHQRFTSTILPTGEGLSVAVKIG